MLSLDSIAFDDAGLHLQSEDERTRAWSLATGPVVELSLRRVAPAFSAPLDEPENLGKAFRLMTAQQGAGLVEFSVITVDGYPALRTIVKTIQDQQTGWGRSYLGAIHIPFQDFSFLLKAQSQELGMTGVRETVVLDRLLGAGRLRFRFEQDGTPAPRRILGPADMHGWLVDAADPTPLHLARNVAEDPQYDSEFPDHPLSEVRAFLNRVHPSIRIAHDVKATCLPWVPARRRPWWRWWRSGARGLT